MKWEEKKNDEKDPLSIEEEATSVFASGKKNVNESHVLQASTAQFTCSRFCCCWIIPYWQRYLFTRFFLFICKLSVITSYRFSIQRKMN